MTWPECRVTDVGNVVPAVGSYLCFHWGSRITWQIPLPSSLPPLHSVGGDGRMIHQLTRRDFLEGWGESLELQKRLSSRVKIDFFFHDLKQVEDGFERWMAWAPPTDPVRGAHGQKSHPSLTASYSQTALANHTSQSETLGHVTESNSNKLAV